MKLFLNILFYSIIGLLIAYIFVNVLYPEKSIDIFRVKTYVIVTSSMEPDININDIAVVIKIKESKLHVRDAITFKAYIPRLNDYSYVTHYIGAIEEQDGTTIYKTQGATKAPGDYDNWTDSFGKPVNITYDDIQGKYLFKIPYVGSVVEAVKDPILDALILVNIGLIYIIIKYIKHIKKEPSE